MANDTNDIDNRLKKSLQRTSEELAEADLIEAQKEFRRRHYEMRLSDEDAASTEASMEATKHIKNLMEWCNEVLKRSVAGYENFSSVMSSMIPGLLLFGEMTGSSFNLLTLPGKVFVPLTREAGYWITEPLMDMAGRGLGKMVGSKPEVPIAALRYFVDLNANGSLAVHSLHGNIVRADGKEITSEQEMLFEEGIAAWLKTTDNGAYKIQQRPDKSYNVIHKDSGRKLDRAEFLALRDDETHGLSTFMEAKFDVLMEQLGEKPETPKPRM